MFCRVVHVSASLNLASGFSELIFNESHFSYQIFRYIVKNNKLRDAIKLSLFLRVFDGLSIFRGFLQVFEGFSSRKLVAEINFAAIWTR